MTFKSLFPCLLLLFFAVQFEAISQDKKPVSIDDLVHVKRVNNPRISPDGKWIAYTVTEVDTAKDKSETRVWMIPAQGGDALPMTAKGYSASSPRWSPDNKYLSFLAEKAEEKTQVYTLNRLGGEAQKLTDVKQGVSGFEWSPNGQQLVLVLRDPKPEELTEDKEDDKKAKPYVIDRLQFKQDYVGYLDRYRNHLYTFNLADKKVTQITSGDFEDSNPVWSPDGKSIAFVSNRTDNPDANTNSDIFVVNANNTDKGQKLVQVTTNENADDSPAWSPDGKNIAYLTITDAEAIWYAVNKLAIAPATGGKPQLLTTDLDRNISKPEYSRDGKRISFILEDHGKYILSSIETSGKNLKKMVDGELSVADYTRNADKFALLVGKSLEPNEVYSYNGQNLQQLTNLNKDLLDSIEKPIVEKISFKSADGTPIEGFVVKPPNFDPNKKYPGIVWIHGGPVAQYDYSFDSPSQLFAANGYVTLLVNPRGSSGYGQDFSEAIFADWGNKDFQDLMAGVDYVVKEGYVDPDRLGVGGWSYGGVLTNHVITKTNRFKGAISGASEALYRTNYGHDHYQLLWEKELGLPWENAEAWERISPFNDVDKIETPTLWIGGSADWNVPIINSEQMYQAMKRLGKKTQLVVYPGEHHGISKPSFVKDRYERYLEWFDKYVK